MDEYVASLRASLPDSLKDAVTATRQQRDSSEGELCINVVVQPEGRLHDAPSTAAIDELASWLAEHAERKVARLTAMITAGTAEEIAEVVQAAASADTLDFNAIDRIEEAGLERLTAAVQGPSADDGGADVASTRLTKFVLNGQFGPEASTLASAGLSRARHASIPATTLAGWTTPARYPQLETLSISNIDRADLVNGAVALVSQCDGLTHLNLAGYDWDAASSVADRAQAGSHGGPVAIFTIDPDALVKRGHRPGKAQPLSE